MPFGSKTTRTLLALMLCIGGLGVIVLRAGWSSDPVVLLPESGSPDSLRLAKMLDNPKPENQKLEQRQVSVLGYDGLPSPSKKPDSTDLEVHRTFLQTSKVKLDAAPVAKEPARIQPIQVQPSKMPVAEIETIQPAIKNSAPEKSIAESVKTRPVTEPVSDFYARTDSEKFEFGPPLTPKANLPEKTSEPQSKSNELFVVPEESKPGEPIAEKSGSMEQPPSRYILPTIATNKFAIAASASTSPTTTLHSAAIPTNEFPANEPKKVLASQLPDPQSPDLSRATNYKLAEQPQIGEHTSKAPPEIDCRATAVPPGQFEFQSDLAWSPTHDPAADMAIYNEKQCQPTQRPAVELFRPWYQRGQLPESRSWFGFHNPDQFQFIVAGDQRTAYASNTQNGNSTSLIAAQLNLDFDLRLTSTERFHWFITPLTQGANSTRWLMDDDRVVSELNADVLFGYFEGDLGAMAGGMTNKTLPFDLPFSVGVMPLVIQNGVWMDDTILGIATTLPAQNMPALNISNFDITFLFGMDQLNSPAFGNDNNAAKIYAIMAFIEAWDGYVEADYAFLEDRDAVLDRSYHNISIGYTRRYGFISNSTRVIANAGQSTDGGPNTADGVLFLSENSLVTGAPYNIVPYLNMFAGFDRPQSAARQAAAGGVLRNTGILFESDNLTGYPTLDATANDTFGMALGMNILPPDFTHQLVLETAFLGTMGDDALRNAAGNQYGVGARYQIPISHHSLIRMDAMYGAFENTSDVHGARIEYRHKF